MSADLNHLAEQLSALTVLEASELCKLLEDKWGVSAAAPVTAIAAPGAPTAPAAPQVEEQTEFSAILTAVGEKRINVIKEVRAITGLGLKETKDLVDGIPKALKEGIPRPEADKIKQQLEAIGATVDLR